MPDSVTALISQFIEYLRVEKNYSPATIRAYSADLAEFREFLSENGPSHVSEVEHLCIRNHISRLASLNGLSKRTIARKLASLRSFFKYLVSREHINTNPALYVRTPKLDSKLPVYLTLKEMEKLLNGPPPTGFGGTRDRALLEVLYSTGVRVSELVSFNWGAVDIDEGIGKVSGKGKKERIVVIGPYACDALREYRVVVELKFSRTLHGKDPVFLNKYGNRLTSRSVRRMLKKYIKKALLCFLHY